MGKEKGYWLDFSTDTSVVNKNHTKFEQTDFQWVVL